MREVIEPKFVYERIAIETPLVAFLKKQELEDEIFDFSSYVMKVVEYDLNLRNVKFKQEQPIGSFLNHHVNKMLVVLTVVVMVISQTQKSYNVSSLLTIIFIVIVMFLMDKYRIKNPELRSWVKTPLKEYSGVRPMELLEIELLCPVYFEIEVLTHPESRQCLFTISETRAEEKYYIAHLEQFD